MTGTANKISSSVFGTPVRASIISTSTCIFGSSSSPSSVCSLGMNGFGSLISNFLFLPWLSLFFLFFFVSFAVPEDYKRIFKTLKK